MVTMVSGKPMTAMERGRAAGNGARFRTRADVPALRLTRRGRAVAAGVSALAIGALSIALATAALPKSRTHPCARRAGRAVSPRAAFPS